MVDLGGTHFVDVVTLILLSFVDPMLLLSPWDYPTAELLLPLGLEFSVLLFSFPLAAYAINRRMAEVQTKVRELADDASRRYGPRGLNFALKQGVLGAGAGTNLWVEVQVVPMVHVQSPVPVPVPTVCPIVIPGNADARAGGGGGAGGTTPASASTAGVASPAAGGAMADAVAAAAASSGGGGSLDARQVEYLRVLQENQLLRQYLAQHQALIQQLLAQQAAGMGRPAGAVPEPPAVSPAVPAAA